MRRIIESIDTDITMSSMGAGGGILILETRGMDHGDYCDALERSSLDARAVCAAENVYVIR